MAIRFIFTSAGTPLGVGASVYSDASLSAKAADGVYSDGTNSYTVVNGVITSEQPC